MHATLRTELLRTEGPTLRLLEGKNAAPETSRAGLGAWILLFGSLCASGGHGIFLASALTRLEKMPSGAELGGPLQTVVIGWFVLGVPLALGAVFLRGRFMRLAARWAWSLASLTTLCTAVAFATHLRAIALA